MKSSTLTINEDYWETFAVNETDLEFLYNHLLELETPQTTEDLVKALVIERIDHEKQALINQQNAPGAMYLPKDQHQVGQLLVFPGLNFQEGKVTDIRPANNPDSPPFNVIEVSFIDGQNRLFASSLEAHILNSQPTYRLDDPLMDPENVLDEYGEELTGIIFKSLISSSELARVGKYWFPRALVLDVNIGHLNLAEALLDMENGGPLNTEAILSQIDLPTDVNKTLTEFSLNLALEEDERFDEVGPAGEIIWFLNRLEPEEVLKTPRELKYSGPELPKGGGSDELSDLLDQFEGFVNDELESNIIPFDGHQVKEAEVSLIYPHWRAGTVPLSKQLKPLFPTSMVTPRIQFTFVDEDSGSQFPGWVVRERNYIYGLREWYEELGLMPGSLVFIKKGNVSGQVSIRAKRQRPSREWIRTVLVGADKGIVFAMLKQMVTAHFNERMSIAIPDVKALDLVWEQGYWEKKPLEKIILTMMRELTKLNPQGHVHAQELYAVVNIIRRCPPGPILSTLLEQPWASHLGDLYFRLNTEGQEE